jgi:glycosyltransferase involved in cell wall biosynthesis
MGGIANSFYNLSTELSKNSELEVSFLCFNPFLHKKFQDLFSNITIYSPLVLQYFFIDFQEAKKNLKPHQFIVYLLIKFLSKIIGRNAIRSIFINNFYKGFSKTNFDVAISFSNDIPKSNTNLGCNDLVENVIKSKKKIAWIHNDLQELGFTKDYILSRYQGFNKVVTVSNYCKDAFEELAPEFKSKSYLVHNFISEHEIITKGNLENPYKKKSEKILVTVARIDNHQKRIDRILKSAKGLLEKGYDFQWYILGDGPDLKKLKEESKKLKLNQFVHFLGFKENPYPFIKNADCFVLSSAFEAQGMVLTESLILDTPVITTDFPAAKEFVKQNINGLISENSTESLYASLEQIFTNKELLSTFRENCRNNKMKLSDEAIKEFNTLL